MPIKFSELTTKSIDSVTRVIGLYADNSSSTGSSNCLINVTDFAKQSALDRLNQDAVHIYGTETIQGDKTFAGASTFNNGLTVTGVINGNALKDGEGNNIVQTYATKTELNQKSSWSLFDFKWTDYTLNDMSWLRSDTFSWHDGEVYSHAYNHLTADLTSATAETVFYDYNNCKPIGTLVNNNGVISNFNNTNYLVTPTVNFSDNTWEYVIKFKTNPDYSVGQIIIHPNIKNGSVKNNIAVWITTAGKLSMHASSNGSSWNIFTDKLGTTVLAPNTVYYVKYEFTGSEYKMSLSSDGSTWNLENSISSTAKVFNNQDVVYGAFPDNTGRYVTSIDLNASQYKIGDITYKFSSLITQYTTTDGHIIVLPNQESKVEEIYQKNGVAWYYIVDTTNKRFKLPRINSSRERLIQIVRAKGNGITLGVTNDDANFALGVNGGNYSAITPRADKYGYVAGSAYGAGQGSPGTRSIGITRDSTKSGIISDMSESTSSYKGHKYLYFYVGQFNQSAAEQTAGINAELFNNKMDRDMANAPSNIDYVVEWKMPTEQDRTWYRKYKSGWLEQGGYAVSTAGANQIFVFPKPFQTTCYHFNATNEQIGDAGVNVFAFQPLDNTKCYYCSAYNGSFYAEGFYWIAKGY